MWYFGQKQTNVYMFDRIDIYVWSVGRMFVCWNYTKEFDCKFYIQTRITELYRFTHFLFKLCKRNSFVAFTINKYLIYNDVIAVEAWREYVNGDVESYFSLFFSLQLFVTELSFFPFSPLFPLFLPRIPWVHLLMILLLKHIQIYWTIIFRKTPFLCLGGLKSIFRWQNKNTIFRQTVQYFLDAVWKKVKQN